MEYHRKMVSSDKLLEMRHPFDTNGNESLNMRNAEVAPKHKNFSRTPSLKWRIQNVIGVHNSGYEKFYEDVFQKLQLHSTDVTKVWLLNKDKTRAYQNMLRKKPVNKRKRIHKRNHKSNEELLLERTKNPKIGTYGAGIGVHGSPIKKRKVTVRGYCDCGGVQKHKNKNSKHCLLPRNSEKQNFVDTTDKAIVE